MAANSPLKNTEIEAPQRWDQPFAEHWGEGSFEQVLAMPFFASMDQNKFPNNLPLSEIIRNDTRLISFADGDIVAREGDYGNSAFLIVSGELSVVLPPGLPDVLLGRSSTPETESWWSACKRLFNRSKAREVREYAGKDSDFSRQLHVQHGVARVRLKDPHKALENCQLVTIAPGELVGEVAALTRSSRTATLIVLEKAELLEIRWQGFRELRKYNEAFRRRVDDSYQNRNKISYLKAIPFLHNVDEDKLLELSDLTLLENFGDVDWKASHKSDEYRPQDEPSIVRQGDYIDGLLVLISGSARILSEHNASERTIGFLRAGDTFGLVELLENLNQSDENQKKVHRFSLTAIGHAEILRIPTAELESTVFDNMSASGLEALGLKASYPSEKVDSGFPAFVGDHRFANGRSTMVINTDRCVRCDDCVSACARNHDNNPRFVRHGHQFANLMIVNSCMHCDDPVCMVGCPTGAISRRIEGQVVINDETCIGCSSCANACPYDNIRMVNISDSNGNPLINNETLKPIAKASKCDLCIDNLGGPACERACAHDALMRVDFTDSQSLSSLVAQAVQFE